MGQRKGKGKVCVICEKRIHLSRDPALHVCVCVCVCEKAITKRAEITLSFLPLPQYHHHQHSIEHFLKVDSRVRFHVR